MVLRKLYERLYMKNSMLFFMSTLFLINMNACEKGLQLSRQLHLDKAAVLERQRQKGLAQQKRLKARDLKFHRNNKNHDE